MSKDLDHHLSAKGIAKNTFWIYLATFLIAPMQYVIRMLVADNLPIEQVWIFYSLLGLTWILAIYNDLWFREAIAYFYPQYLANKQYDKSKTILVVTFIFQIISSCVLAGLLWYFADSIAIHYFKDPTWVFAIKTFGIYLLFYICYNFIDWLFMIFQNGFWNKLLWVLNYVLLIGFVWFVPHGMFDFIGVQTNMTWYILAWIIPSIICLVIWWCVFFYQYRSTISRGEVRLNRSEYRTIQKYALWVLITNNILYLISQIDLQFTTYYFGPKEVALYGYGMMLTNMMISLLSPIAGLLYPMIAHFKARQQPEKIAQVLYGIFNYLGMIALVASLFLFTFSVPITTMLFWSEYAQWGMIVRRNLLFVVFGLWWSIMYSVYAGLWMIKDRIKMLVWILLINIVLNLTLPHMMWVNGIALSVWITRLVMFWYSYRDLTKHRITIRIDWKRFVIMTCIGIGVLLLLTTVSPFDDQWSRVSILKYILFLWAIYAIILIIYNISRIKDIMSFVKQLIKPSSLS